MVWARVNGRPGRYAPVGSGSFDSESGVLRLRGVAPGPDGTEEFAYRVDGLLHDGELTVGASFGSWADNLQFTRRGARWRWRHSLARAIKRTVDRVLGTRTFAEE